MSKKLSIKEAKELSIKHPLDLAGITAVKKYNGYGMYYAFDREESTPSLKVDYNKNLYYDFGNAKGGDIISLVQLMKKCSVSEALTFLSGNENINSLSFHQQKKIIGTKKDKEINYKITAIEKLKHPALLKYLESRKIDLNIAKVNCIEIHFVNNSKNYFSVGFKNNSGGYSVRNKYQKGSLICQDITLVSNCSKSIVVFEGFMDYLSYLTLYQKEDYKEDFMILNSTSLLNKNIPKLKDYSSISCYFDNDTTGGNAFNLVKENYNYAKDCSDRYSNYNDLNKHLILKK